MIVPEVGCGRSGGRAGSIHGTYLSFISALAIPRKWLTQSDPLDAL
jgi:hypothetical protein